MFGEESSTFIKLNPTIIIIIIIILVIWGVRTSLRTPQLITGFTEHPANTINI